VGVSNAFRVLASSGSSAYPSSRAGPASAPDPGAGIPRTLIRASSTEDGVPDPADPHDSRQQSGTRPSRQSACAVRQMWWVVCRRCWPSASVLAVNLIRSLQSNRDLIDGARNIFLRPKRSRRDRTSWIRSVTSQCNGCCRAISPATSSENRLAELPEFIWSSKGFALKSAALFGIIKDPFRRPRRARGWTLIIAARGLCSRK